MPPPALNHYVVIGSGPSGMAAAAALLDRDQRVTIVDAGRELDPARATRAAGMARGDPEAWSDGDRAWLTQGLDDDASAIPLKRLFNDGFTYAGSAWTIRGGALPPGFAQWPSQAAGGLSRVWGATLKRLDTNALRAWPIAQGALDPHYGAIEALLAVCLDKVRVDVPLAASAQARRILQQWQVRPAALNALGVRAMPSDLAVSPACRLCGMCLHGCPYGYIFSSTDMLRRYRPNPQLTYRSGLKAKQIVEHGAGCDVVCIDDRGEELVLGADRVFVAAGVLETTRLILASVGRLGDQTILRDSQYFLLPFLSRHASSKAERLHTLSQIFLELDGAQPSAPGLHAQFYTYNDHYAAEIRRRLDGLGGIAAPVAAGIARRFVMAQGYLHSQESGHAVLRLAGPASHPVLDIDPRRKDETRRHLRAVWARLSRAGRLAGLYALMPLARIADIGAGYHSGATLPMAAEPAGWQSDTLGRPKRAQRVHAVDASVWPAIPSGPVTLTAMANAHRIATEASALDWT